MSQGFINAQNIALPLPVNQGGTGLNSSSGNSVLITDISENVSWSTTLPSGLNYQKINSTGITLNSGTDLQTYSRGLWTPSPTSLTVVGTPTYTGTYIRIGGMVFCTLIISSTTSTASTFGTTTFTGMPFTAETGSFAVNAGNGATGASIGTGYMNVSTLFPPTWGATADVRITFSYYTTSN